MTGFHDLHIKGEPLVLFNVWDAGSARAVAASGAAAIATGSAGVAMAQGFEDGENVPLDIVLANAKRVVAAVDVPVTIDFEGGYAKDGAALTDNVGRLVATGAAGMNFEDCVPGTADIYPADVQARRIQAARQASADLFINARTDVFLRSDPATHADHMEDALGRAAQYADAGADGFFIPGLADRALIARICAGTGLPVNVLWRPELGSAAKMAALGVARISYGSLPYRDAMAALEAAAKAALGGTS
ncbi:isocitrate lyase/phosphoenolpyruvate mutase family protein [Pacificimonas sp. WHA3]|uniref:Isocitrate lyase/phosphoenolpyruvate mutase family protein n=1 Tax=Pacificimonas pallii TaxID=2827236 RepID=A0ABS6SGZ6_9SPHN|nr:isocitrate lyase/phosphoenolpyruvate mutase family protein [Pacificimonas pallii]MBV7257669.1 isocitrate lyase/phosphoenolpyruvate mutase family protein [Pacificimonas pallii]